MKGYSIGVAFVCLSLISSAIYAGGIYRENVRRGKNQAQITDCDPLPLNDEKLGDLHPSYTYIV
jgi:hypothetical protein